MGISTAAFSQQPAKRRRSIDIGSMKAEVSHYIDPISRPLIRYLLVDISTGLDLEWILIERELRDAESPRSLYNQL
jgi:hypothetical protein